MAVKRVEYKNKRAGTLWNAEKNCYTGWRVDIRIGGKRYRNQCFPSREQAEIFIENLKLEEKFEKRGLSDDELVDLFVGVREKKIGFKDFKRAVLAFQKGR